MSDTTERVRGFMKLYAVYAIVGVVCVIYTMIGSFDVEKKEGVGLLTILSDMLVPYVFGICITTLLKEQGLAMGDAEPTVMRAVEAHEAEAQRCAPEVEALSEWCREETARALRQERMRILADEGLVYEDYFTEGKPPVAYEPRMKEVRVLRRGWISRAKWNRMERRREAAFYRAARFRIKPLRAGDLLSEGHRSGNPFYMGRSQAEYRASTFGVSLLTKPLTALIMGYYTIKQIENFQPQVLIWQVFGVAVFVAFGLVAMMQAQDYKKTEYTGRMVRKTGYMRQFRAACLHDGMEAVGAEEKKVTETEPEKATENGKGQEAG